MIWSLNVSSATLGGTPSPSMLVTIPGGHTAPTSPFTRLAYSYPSVGAYAYPSGSTLTIGKEDGTNWPLGTVSFIVTVTFRIT
jgi:hypothetical protein